jgi:hypothetical protein
MKLTEEDIELTDEVQYADAGLHIVCHDSEKQKELKQQILENQEKAEKWDELQKELHEIRNQIDSFPPGNYIKTGTTIYEDESRRPKTKEGDC